MRILAIDTSCDETATAVTKETKVLSNIVWSHASLHAKFGGIYPSLAQREHKERIDWVINRAMLNSKCQMLNLDAIAVTVGPGLAPALEVEIAKAKELAEGYSKPLIPVNHIEGHLLSPLARSRMTNDQFPISNFFPALGLVVSGGTTKLILAEKIGKYKILASTIDDALGEALDKGARLLGLGYPGGAILEKFARKGNPKVYPLPIPLLGQEERAVFSYSGLKTALVKLVGNLRDNDELTKEQIYDLAASYQNVAFSHLIRINSHIIRNLKFEIKNFLVGGGVAANIELRKRLRKLCRLKGLKLHLPYSQKLCTDNAAMVGIAASFQSRANFVKSDDVDIVDRVPLAKIDQLFLER